ncbi:MAG: RHS repeat-associated core domain-containing protein [Desulfobacteraceae bacterium]|nr:RHS repeat-associated core domain-containing protein [Desulfobacteraceae bacterium]
MGGGFGPGQYFDLETGLHYNYHRYYDPQLGRYITPDPIGLEGGINTFVYSLNNPINRIDKSGMKSVMVGYGVCGGYAEFFGSKCTRDCEEVDDTYPERAYAICIDFMNKYDNSWRVLGVGRCLVGEEAKCQGYECCAQRNKCRFNAHMKCYAKYAFVDPFNPFGPGFPDGGPELGWSELLPDWWNN